MQLANQLTIFKAFFILGLTAFGGPVAHIAYFRTQFVEKRQWLSDPEFSQLLAISQALPGRQVASWDLLLVYIVVVCWAR